jgi:hypothetical protein
VAIVVAVCGWLFDWPHWLVWYLIPALIVAGAAASWIVEDVKKAGARRRAARV